MLFGIGYMTLCVHALASNRFTLIPQMSHDELVQYIGSMERQVADTEVRTLQVLNELYITITVYSQTHCRKLEAQLNGAREDYNIAQQALRDTKGGLEAELKSVRVS